MSSEHPWNCDRVRKTYIDFFCEKYAHTYVPSSSLCPYNDETLLFANSGMNQFKAIFLGQIDPKSPEAKWKRAANSQKCIRAGGKHNDLDDVGKDTYHHTFFEMLGNWSFGDYFQKDAIDWAWELLTEVYKLNKERLYVTYFCGDVKDNLPADDSAKNLWKKYLPDERILPFGRKENFWEMGETGPCGPCSEIHYDRIGGRDASHLVNRDDPEVIEIWNLVFMQFNREKSGALTELPDKHVDTGMGFERLTSVLQDVHSNYDTDVFKSIFDEIQKVTGAPPYTFKVGTDDVDKKDTAYRIIGDHIRTLTFAISDGIFPSKAGRGNVLRRIVRRAIRAGRDYLGAPDGFFHTLVDVVVRKFGSFFPEIAKNPELIKLTIKTEEEMFSENLTKGTRFFKKILDKLRKNNLKELPPDDAILMYTTHGFPLDLIQILCGDNDIALDVPKFNQILDNIRNPSGPMGPKTSEIALDANGIQHLKDKTIAITDDSFKYQIGEVDAKVVAIRVGSTETGTWEQSLSENNKFFGVILDKTNFYAEAGGQICDVGFIHNDDFQFKVVEIKSYGGYILHVGSLTHGEIKIGSVATCSVNNDRRQPITMNHTSTHMVNYALKRVLGNHISQKGSLVTEEKFRFDFSHLKECSTEEIKRVDEIVNDIIQQGLKVYTKEIDLESAYKIPGIQAMFGEKYPDPVRVVSIGADINKFNEKNDDWSNYSIEFCGGTHLSNSRDAIKFVITVEEPLGAGQRRLEAVTGERAIEAINNVPNMEQLLVKLEGSFNQDFHTLSKSYRDFNTRLLSTTIPYYNKCLFNERLKTVKQVVTVKWKEIEKDLEKKSNQRIPGFIEEIKNNNLKVFIEELHVGGKTKILADAIELMSESINTDVAFMLFSQDVDKNKVICNAKVTPGLVNKLSCKTWVQTVTNQFGGKGGGTDHKASGNCSDDFNVKDMIEFSKKFAEQKINQ